MTLPTLEVLDRDGAIREADDAVAGDTRADLFRKAAVGGGAVLTSGAIMGMLPELAAAKPSKKQDIKILQFALTLEYLEAAFYREAIAKKALRGDTLALTRLVADHETTHVSALRGAIKDSGGKPIKAPAFDFGDSTGARAPFIKTAFALENTGVSAYLGQAGRLKSKNLLRAAASIVTIEARHAAAFAIQAGVMPYDVAGSAITPDGAFDRGFTMKRVLKIVGKTNFIKG